MLTVQSAKIRLGADCGSDHELLIAKFRLILKKVGKTNRPLRYDLNQISYDYTVEVTNRFKGLDLIVSEIETWLPTLWADSLPAEPPGKPKNVGVGSLSLLQGIFPTQESNGGLLHCKRILYQLNYRESPT